MDKDLEAYYLSYMDMFRSNGWKELIKELDISVQNLNNITSIKDGEELANRKGQLMILLQLINLEDTIHSAYDEAELESTND